VIPQPAVMARALAALRRVRPTKFGLSEAALVDLMETALRADGLEPRREVRLAPRCRVDLALPDGDLLLIGIEAKRGRPEATPTTAQVVRYAESGKLSGVILVAERAFDLPPMIGGIPVAALGLHSSFGISL